MTATALVLKPGGCTKLRAVDPASDRLQPPLEPPSWMRIEPGPSARLTLRLFDTWPWDLWHSGRMLLADGGCLRVLDRSAPGRPIAIVAASEPERFAWELPAGPLTREVAPLLNLRALLPMLTLKVQQFWWLVRNADDKIVVRLLEHRWEDARTLQVVALRGYDREANAIRSVLSRRALSDQHPLSLALAGHEPRRWSSKPSFSFAPDTPARAATSEMLTRLLELSRETEAGIRADLDTEFIHDYRVLLRRARSVVSVMKGALSPEDTATLKEGLKALAQRTNLLRDLDVHLLERAQQEARVPESLRADLGPLFDALQVQRDAEQRRIASWLRRSAYAREYARLYELAQRPAIGPLGEVPMRRMANLRLFTALRTVVRRGRAITPETPDDDVHELRIDCKKLRYMVEFFRDLYPKKEIKRLVNALKGLQDLLGTFNDSSVQQEALLAWVDEHPEVPRNTAVAIGVLYHGLHTEQRALRSQVEATFAAFDTAELAELIRSMTGRRLKGIP